MGVTFGQVASVPACSLQWLRPASAVVLLLVFVCVRTCGARVRTSVHAHAQVPHYMQHLVGRVATIFARLKVSGVDATVQLNLSMCAA